MRVFPAFLCFFLFVLFSGTVSFVYVMWTNYWARVSSLETRYSGPITSRHGQHRPPNSRHSLARVDREDIGEPMMREITDTKGLVKRKEAINLEDLPLDKLLAHMKVYKEQLYSQLRNTVIDTAKQVNDANFPNAYNVTYKGRLADNNTQQPSQLDLLCDARNKIKLNTFTKENKMFRKLNLDRFFPQNSLLDSLSFNSCAVVSSAGTMKKSGLGPFIDSHDLVLRFNNAPTENHEADVGKKTSIRIVNSQVVAKPHFKFLEDKFYSKVGTSFIHYISQVGLAGYPSPGESRVRAEALYIYSKGFGY